MITLKQAEVLANEKLRELQLKTKIEISIMVSSTIEFEFGWMFFYQSKSFIETKDMQYMIGGNSPIIVDKYNSSVHLTGTRKSKEFYIETYRLYRKDPELFREKIMVS